MAKQLSSLKVCKTEISENEPRQVVASLINSIIDTVIQLAVKKQKRHTGCPVVSLLNFFGTMLVPKIAEKGVLLRSKRGPRFREKGG